MSINQIKVTEEIRRTYEKKIDLKTLREFLLEGLDAEVKDAIVRIEGPDEYGHSIVCCLPIDSLEMVQVRFHSMTRTEKVSKGDSGFMTVSKGD